MSRFTFDRRRRALLLALPCLLAGCAFPGTGLVGWAKSDAESVAAERQRRTPQPQSRARDGMAAPECFGRLLEAYRRDETAPLYVQSQKISDSTGLSHPLVGAELPTDLTDMLITSVSRIGRKTVYIPNDLDFRKNYAGAGARLSVRVPKVLIGGSITEFDRAIASTARGADLGVSFGKGKGKSEGSVGEKGAYTISRLTIDLNLADVASNTMVPGVYAANSMKVINETAEGNFDFAIFGNGLGFNSTNRYLQGRHDAIRLLVDFSVVQLLGRYLAVPYWRCLPESQADASVIERIERSYLANTRSVRVKWLQSTLRDYGHALPQSGVYDAATHAALEATARRLAIRRPLSLEDGKLFAELYVRIPVSA
ncbi:hypothetical protein [Accumulibacter sp.]|uniref:hypothetical protein n=1 Tax=Accumulibacter sp. TaxID=2053492 RepID=UPI0026249762|nr:hypothetical protein [Accumulibacter sp.]